MHIDRGLFFMPTRRRPESLRRFFEAYRATGAVVGGRIIINLDDWQENHTAYIALPIPDNWGFVQVSANSMCEAMRSAWPLMRELEWTGWIDDDMLPETAGWDVKMVQTLNGWNFVSTNDCWQANADPMSGRMCGAWVFSGGLLRAIGYLVPNGLEKSYVDDVWETIGRRAGNWITRMDIITRHLHPNVGLGAHDDTTEEVARHWTGDTDSYKLWYSMLASHAVVAAMSIMPPRAERNLDVAASHVYAKIWGTSRATWPAAEPQIKAMCMEAARAVLNSA